MKDFFLYYFYPSKYCIKHGHNVTNHREWFECITCGKWDNGEDIKLDYVKIRKAGKYYNGIYNTKDEK